MKSLLALIGAMLLQEPISTSALILNARNHGISSWEINFIFLAATSFEIVFGYYLVKLIERKYPDARILKAVRDRMHKFLSSYGKKGERAALVIATAGLFPISALFAPLLDISFAEAFWYQLGSNALLWYPLVWVPVFGIGHFKTSPFNAIIAVMVIAAIIGILVRVAMKIYSKK